MRRAPILLLTLALVALPLGCGKEGSSTTTSATAAAPLGKSAYVEQMRKIGEGLSTTINAFTSATTPAAIATALEQVRTDLNSGVAELYTIVPPKAIEKEHRALSAAVKKLSEELGPMIDRAKAGKTVTIAELTALDGFGALADASNAIETAGYKIAGG